MKSFPIAVLIALSASTAAFAEPFDGAWIVRVETQSGVCPKSGMLPIQVNEGRIQSNDSALLVSGKVTSKDLKDDMKAATVNGAELSVDLDNGVTVNEANVVNADVAADNGVLSSPQHVAQRQSTM
ncbi:MAG: hypothetical protein EOO38_25630 [Cytophagaceae bacterium]|nr:MAG: hypothetical protein EOO38_25630 [Cytophagaceae bacterium]